MIIFFQEIMMLLFLWLLKLIDGIMEIFSAIAGVGTVNYQGKQVNILDVLIGDSTVGTVFWCIMILAVGLTCLFAIVGLIKNMIANNRQVSGIMGKFFLALLGTLAMLAVVFLGILISNALLKLVNEVFQLNGNTKLSSALFNACVGNWKKGHSIAEFNTNLSVRSIFGSYKKILGIWPDEWKGNGMIDPDSFMYLPALIGSIGLLIALIIACINLAKRIYEIVMLYLVMPVSMSTLPLDDGARFKIWRETFVTKIILAYGTVFAVNLFILLLPIITQMKVTGASSFANSIFYIFMLVGGAVVIPAAQQLFAKLFGSAEEQGHGSHFLRSAAFGGRMVGAAAIGLTAKGIKGGVSLGKKAFGKKGGGDKKDGGGGDGGGSEKFSEESKGSDSGGDGGNDSEKHTDNQSSNSDSNDSQSTNTATDTNNSSTDSSSDNGDNSDSEKHTDSQSSNSESSDSQSTGTTADGNNGAAVVTESGNSNSATSSTDSKANDGNQTATATTDTNSSAANGTDSKANVDNQTATATTDTNSSAASTDSTSAATVTDNAPSADNSDNGKHSEGQTATVSTDNQTTSVSTEDNKYSENPMSAASTDGQPSAVNADSDKHSENTTSTVKTDSNSAAVVTDSKTSVNTESSKYSESQSSATTTDAKLSMSTTETKPLPQNADSRNQAPTQNTDKKPTAANKDKPLSESTDSGKYSANTDDTDIGGNE